MINKGAAGVAVAASVTATSPDFTQALISLGLGLCGVMLSRRVFVDKQSRKLGRRQSWRESLPLTLIAMLIAGVVIWDRDLGKSAAAFTGLGVGWTAILLLDVLGDRALAFIRVMSGSPEDPVPDASDLQAEIEKLKGPADGD